MRVSGSILGSATFDIVSPRGVAAVAVHLGAVEAQGRADRPRERVTRFGTTKS